MNTIFGILILGVFGLIALIPFWRICKRCGLSPSISLLTLIPLLGAAVPWIIALSDWPGENRTKPGGTYGPEKGVIYTPSEMEQFRRSSGGA